ncbi:acyl carrier protein [Methylobacterium sp. J-070]|uniref:acyl carrier protein n=1 Tax=Methylobacterium sp. J-070 TaxID=2836650 RepID=UPI001FBB9333|nr:acyl carrier protein [Methylobacterium sp. J-070]MCJ2052955.1 acyl carrier protein [Methylobacterium sp. J-070]
MSVRPILLSEMTRIADENQKSLPPLVDDLVMLETEFDSLCFALLVAGMEERTGLDPFTEMDMADLPVTVGELVALYDRAQAHAAA